jgi:hypothetical protein
MNKDLLKASIEAMTDRETFSFCELADLSGQTAVYAVSPTGEGKRFWAQVENGEFNTNEYEIRPVLGKTNPQRYQKWSLEQPIIAPNSGVSICLANELLKPLGKILAIIPIRRNGAVEEIDVGGLE